MAGITFTRPWTCVCVMILFCCLNASDANAQARWLTQKTKPFTSGKSTAEVLEELAAAHKFKVEYSSEDAKTEASAVLVLGNMEGVPLETTIRVLCSNMTEPLPWTADKTTLTISSPTEMTAVTYNISRFGPLLSNADEFRYAVTNIVDAEWEEADAPPDPEGSMGNITDLSASSVTVRQTPVAHYDVARLFNKLSAAASGSPTSGGTLGDSKIAKSLEKSQTLPEGEISSDDLFAKAFTGNKIPWFVRTAQLDLENLKEPFKLEGKKQRLRETLEPLLTERKSRMLIDSGVLIITSVDDVGETDSVVVYNVQKFLNNFTTDQISRQIRDLDGVNIDAVETLGPFLIIDADPETHKKIAAAVGGK